MYKRIRDGLFDPKKVANYIGDKFIFTVFVVLFFAILVTIPTVYTLITYQVPYEVKSEFKEEFANENLPYKIENGELTRYDSSLVSDPVITVNGVNYAFLDAKINNPGALVVRFNKENVTIEYMYYRFVIMDYLDYEQLNHLNLNDLSKQDVEAWSKVFTSVNQLYDNNKTMIVSVYSVVTLLSNISMFFIVGLMLALGSLIRLRGLIKFSSMYKLALYDLAPFAVGLLISDLVNVRIIFYIGIIISFVYKTIGETEIFKKIYSHHTEE